MPKTYTNIGIAIAALGVIIFVVGFAVDIPYFSLTKTGIIIAVIGLVNIGYGMYRSGKNRSSRDQ